MQNQLPIKAGGVQNQVGICYDVFPTIANLAGATLPADYVVDGQDLKKLLNGERRESRREVFLSHFPHEHTSDYFTTWRNGDWKLIYRYFPESNKESDRFALYNLRNDPSESTNLSAGQPDIVNRLSQEMIESLVGMNALYPVVDGKQQRPELLQTAPAVGLQ